MALELDLLRSPRLGEVLRVRINSERYCSYACPHCLHRDRARTLHRQSFSHPEEIREVVSQQLARLRAAGHHVDHLGLAFAGELTLDLRLGEVVDALAGLGVPLAAKTNGSLLSRDDVRNELARIDWLALQVNAGSEQSWRRVHSPDPSLRFATVLQGLRVFGASYDGALHTETTLLHGVNTSRAELESIADRVAGLRPRAAWMRSKGAPDRNDHGDRFRQLLAERGIRAVWLPPEDHLNLAKATPPKLSLVTNNACFLL